ncbi:hypothetical protein HRbin40_00350 [bacterium HR40]|nr:hypothetical protein HRbin40_00350 [bacterium HR40]
MRRFAIGILLVGLVSGLSGPARAAELVMFESALCEWCRAWHAEIGPIYPKTPEGRLAPLRRVDIAQARPADLDFIEGVRYTPTFVLVDAGREIGRIVGYAGEEAFWGQLAELVQRLAPPTGQRATD